MLSHAKSVSFLACRFTHAKRIGSIIVHLAKHPVDINVRKTGTVLKQFKNFLRYKQRYIYNMGKK